MGPQTLIPFSHHLLGMDVRTFPRVIVRMSFLRALPLGGYVFFETACTLIAPQAKERQKMLMVTDQLDGVYPYPKHTILQRSVLVLLFSNFMRNFSELFPRLTNHLVYILCLIQMSVKDMLWITLSFMQTNQRDAYFLCLLFHFLQIHFFSPCLYLPIFLIHYPIEILVPLHVKTNILHYLALDLLEPLP